MEKIPAADPVQMMTISLFIILLAFFILLNTIAVIDDQKKLAVMDSLLGSFGVLTGGTSVVMGSGGNMALPEMAKISSHVDFSDLMVGNEDIIKLITVKTDYRGTVLSIPTDLLFEKKASRLKPEGLKILDGLHGAIRKNEFPVEIVGHTDNRLPQMETGVSNRELSSIRSLRILQHVLNRGSVKPDRITAFGWGQYRPVVTNKTRETREHNRRMDIQFIHDGVAEKPRGIFTFRKFFFNVFE
ncbi:MAG TPA: OmpA family protein [Deltaproteobacteria bacterium]|nr:OmpA family protein [Deltaproteobacteria bacterium]